MKKIGIFFTRVQIWYFDVRLFQSESLLLRAPRFDKFKQKFVNKQVLIYQKSFQHFVRYLLALVYIRKTFFHRCVSWAVFSDRKLFFTFDRLHQIGANICRPNKELNPDQKEPVMTDVKAPFCIIMSWYDLFDKDGCTYLSLHLSYLVMEWKTFSSLSYSSWEEIQTILTTTFDS